jgi:hypothetical protein
MKNFNVMPDVMSKMISGTKLSKALSSALFSACSSAPLFAVVALLTSCASKPPPPAAVDPVARENAIFACKQSIQAQKKARFAKLPKVIQRLAGDNQVLKQFDHPPRRRELYAPIAKFPLAGDSGGTWAESPEAYLRTLSTRFDRPALSKDETESVDLITMNFGQPPRIYAFPIARLKPYRFGSAYQGGLLGKSGDDTLQIRVVDEHHLLILASTEKSKDPKTRFAIGNMYALVRTYSQQPYAEETKQQLSDYPVYDPEWNEMACDQEIDNRR